MAYPFTKAPTVKEFITRAQTEFDCRCNHSRHNLVGPRGPVTVSYLFRAMPDGSTRRSQTLPSNPGERLGPEMLRLLCRQLEIPVEVFDMPLG